MTRPTNATERLALRQAYIPKGARCVLEHTNGSACYVYEQAGKFYVIAFWGTSAKCQFHETYRTTDARDRRVLDWKQGVEQSVSFRQKMKDERKATPNTLKAGDILHTSWGYDQTNVDFYIVTRVSGKRVYVREIAGDYEATGYMSGRTWPAMPIRFVGEETMHTSHGSSLTINGHHASLTTSDTYTSSYA